MRTRVSVRVRDTSRDVLEDLNLGHASPWNLRVRAQVKATLGSEPACFRRFWVRFGYDDAFYY